MGLGMRRQLGLGVSDHIRAALTPVLTTTPEHLAWIRRLHDGINVPDLDSVDPHAVDARRSKLGRLELRVVRDHLGVEPVPYTHLTLPTTAYVVHPVGRHTSKTKSDLHYTANYVATGCRKRHKSRNVR